jgi:hypothetical protein
MGVDDVPIIAHPPWIDFENPTTGASPRLTFQHFKDVGKMVGLAAPHNSDARRLSDSEGWPPPWIFDVAYGCTVLNTWGVGEFMEFARRRVEGRYYGEGGGGDNQNSAKRNSKSHSKRKARRWVQMVGYHAFNRPDSPDADVADIILGLWTHSARKAQRQARAKKVERTKEKVREWRDSLE